MSDGVSNEERRRENQEINDLLRRRMLRELRRQEAHANSHWWQLPGDPPVWLTCAGMASLLVLAASGGIVLGSILAGIVRGRTAFTPTEADSWPDLLFLAGLVLIGASLFLLGMAAIRMRRR
ncbi:hypothetical protein HVPorG_04723 (plasmid) [Roseomonas mucosa]|jgi:hypothetical protein|uniref:Uncharacterized protein n=1 Tax=Roseomonas mucosa TaxID=207340 RepID=A0A1S8D0D3_9PROT|nr:hypothetical protein [Roseomonas mucosa]MBS5905392.1 hypothetical protein [Acetobacteraceae bacterium]PZR07625.1 MAG: hypothetical protein DI532_23410 [Azospirillum brasilense]ONH81782.1 hypothetical protein APZ41_017995 [Roseomonas mucosa]QDD97358.1 hypothetical protein ADP8_04723 [Roseomonas mucosa]QDJ12142.1 hypothetical protein HVPorG_04723 [Roseomonas mucosa]